MVILYWCCSSLLNPLTLVVSEDEDTAHHCTSRLLQALTIYIYAFTVADAFIQ